MIESSIKAMEEKNFDKARVDLQELLNRDENDTEYAGPYAVHGETYYLTSGFDEAIEMARKALKLEPNIALA